MDLFSQYQYPAVALLARLFLACLFFFQGYDAVFRVGIRQVAHTYESDFANHGIPKPLTLAASWYTKLSELIGGFLLVPGFLTYPALYLLGINLLIAATGFGITVPVWDTRHVFPRLALLLLLLAIPAHWHLFSLDHILFNR